MLEFKINCIGRCVTVVGEEAKQFTGKNGFLVDMLISTHNRGIIKIKQI